MVFSGGRNFRPYIRQYTSPNEFFNMVIPILMHFFKLELCKPNKAAHHLTICGVIEDVKLFLTVYRRKYCRKFLTLSNQTSRYKSKCIRMFAMTRKIYNLFGNKKNNL